MILRGKDPATQQLVECEVVDGKIASLHAASGPAPAGTIGGEDLYLAPGMVDIQVNGFGGIDLESPTLTTREVYGVMQAQWKYGVTQFMPTIVTGTTERIVHGMKTVAAAVEEFPEVRVAVPGIHLEGPYFCPDDGPRGAHILEYIRKPSWAEFEQFQKAARGMIRMVTLAPDVEGAIPFIEQLTANNVIAAIGHTNLGEADLAAAVKAGAQTCTHLGNGSHNMMPRHANYIQMQMACDDLWASIITDGHHLPPYFVKNMVRAKGVSRCILTTDAISAAGAPPGRYKIAHVEVEVGPDRRVRSPHSNSLAGSACSLDECVTNVVRWAKLSLAGGLAMATTHPAKLLALKSYGLAEGSAANLMLFRWDGTMHVTHTILAGKVVFQQS